SQSLALSAPTLPHPAPGSALADARTIRRSEPDGRAASRSGGGSRSDTGGSGTDVRSLVVRMAAVGHAGHPRCAWHGPGIIAPNRWRRRVTGPTMAIPAA